jgi:hypothetical protein
MKPQAPVLQCIFKLGSVEACNGFCKMLMNAWAYCVAVVIIFTGFLV